MLGALSSWLYDRDPFEPLRFEKPLADLRARLAKGARFTRFTCFTSTL
jgi:Zn-dependent M16 (insulinase) family peptidase